MVKILQLEEVEVNVQTDPCLPISREFRHFHYFVTHTTESRRDVPVLIPVTISGTALIPLKWLLKESCEIPSLATKFTFLHCCAVWTHISGLRGPCVPCARSPAGSFPGINSMETQGRECECVRVGNIATSHILVTH